MDANVADLARRFQHDMIADSRAYIKRTKTNPSRYLQMIAAQGGVATADRLASDPTFHEGFTRAWEHHCLELTAEYLIAYGRDGAYRNLFSADTVASAERKLRQVGVTGAPPPATP